jgi:hypothetical protein
MSAQFLIRYLATSKALELLSHPQTEDDSQRLTDVLLHIAEAYPEGSLTDIREAERMMAASSESMPPSSKNTESGPASSLQEPTSAPAFSLRKSFMSDYKPFNVLEIFKDITIPCDDNVPPHVVDLHLDGPVLIKLYERPIDPRLNGLALVSAYIERGAKIVDNFYRTTAVEPRFNLADYHVDHLFKCADVSGLHVINLRFNIEALHKLYYRSVDLKNLPSQQIPSVYQECGGVVHDICDKEDMPGIAAIREFTLDGEPTNEAHFLNGMPCGGSGGSLTALFGKDIQPSREVESMRREGTLVSHPPISLIISSQ